jgi:hypothetical protein
MLALGRFSGVIVVITDCASEFAFVVIEAPPLVPLVEMDPPSLLVAVVTDCVDVRVSIVGIVSVDASSAHSHFAEAVHLYVVQLGTVPIGRGVHVVFTADGTA